MTQHLQTKHISCLSRIEEDRYVWLDRFTVRNLELYGSNNEGAKTLVDIIDKTISPMGGRMLRRWVAFPLKNVKPIQDRQSVVGFFMEHQQARSEATRLLSMVGDLERLISKVAVNRINPREVVQLRYALEAIEPIKQLCNESNNEYLRNMGEQLNPCSMIRWMNSGPCPLQARTTCFMYNNGK